MLSFLVILIFILKLHISHWGDFMALVLWLCDWGMVPALPSQPPLLHRGWDRSAGGSQLDLWGASAGGLSQKHVAVSGKIEHVPAAHRQEEGTVGRCAIRQMAKLIFQTSLAPSHTYQGLHSSSFRDALPAAFLQLTCECFLKTPRDMWS